VGGSGSVVAGWSGTGSNGVGCVAFVAGGTGVGCVAGATVVAVGAGVTAFKPGDRVAGGIPHASRANVESSTIVASAPGPAISGIASRMTVVKTSQRGEDEQDTTA